MSQALARLLIHSTVSTLAGDASGSAPRLLMRCLRALAADALRQPVPAPLLVRIDDLQGRRWLEREIEHDIEHDIEHESGRPLIDVPLPAGTYHVSVQRGGRRWRYTVTLEQDTAFELFVHEAGA